MIQKLNHLGQLTHVTDDAGTRTIGYNAYGEQETDSLLADNVTHLITETRDTMGRSTGFTYAKNGTVQHTVTTGYGTDGRIATAGFLHSGTEKQFSYGYLPGSNLLQTLTMPCNMTLTQSYETQRDLLIGMAYLRGNTLVTQRSYTYDTLGRPLTRSTARNGQTVNDSFVHNSRSELASATANGINYGYAYDNIGNRTAALEESSGVASRTTYTANELNQYTSIQENEEAAFVPTFDADGNQTLVKTATGIWSVQYNAENRPVRFTSADGSTVIECSYDTLGLRATKKVTTNGSITLHQRYIYRGYLQLACCDLTRSGHPALWFITWDPTQPIATRPLAIRKDGTWFAYGWDLTKNICEVFGPAGYLRTAYTYTPYGEVTANGDVTQPIQWSSEFNDAELALVYYNYRHHNPVDGRWLGRDAANREDYIFCNNSPYYKIDISGLDSKTVGRISSLDIRIDVETNGAKGHASMHIHVGDDKYDYRNDRVLPGFYDRETGKPLPRSVQKKLGKHKDWKKIMDKAERAVKNNGGLSPKFGGGKVIKGCVSIVGALESVNMLNDYVNAMKKENIRQMDQVFHNFMSNLPDYGTIVRSSILMDADKFHREMKSFVLKNRK